MSKERLHDELRDEYSFDYSKAKPNRFATSTKESSATQKQPVPQDQTTPSVEDNLRQLREAAAQFARQREEAEAKVSHINPTIEQLRNSKLLAADHTIIGQIVHSKGYGETETAHYFAAGIQGDGGIGAFEFWLDFGDEPDEFTHYHFVPFSECPPIVQARLAGHIEELMSRLMWDLKVTPNHKTA